MDAKATHKGARVAPRKVRLLRPLVLGKGAGEALAVLSVGRRAGALLLKQVIRSALAQLPEELASFAVVKDVVVNEGPMRRMYMPRARGRASPVRKRTSHLSVKLTTASGK